MLYRILLDLFVGFSPVQRKITHFEIWTPLIVLLSVTVFIAIPIFRLEGVLIGVFYTLPSFIWLCFLRRWIMGWSAYPTSGEEYKLYISPSSIMQAQCMGVFLPSMVWLLVSFGFITFFWHWSFGEYLKSCF
jgi:hypothetical protein